MGRKALNKNNLPWYCMHCSMEFKSQEGLWLHKCEKKDIAPKVDIK